MARQVRIVNQCNHPVTLDLPAGTLTLQTCGEVVRVADRPEPVEALEADGYTIPVERVYPLRETRLEGLLAPKEGRVVVVSRLVAEAVALLHPERRDVYYPCNVAGAGAAAVTRGLAQVEPKALRAPAAPTLGGW